MSQSSISISASSHVRLRATSLCMFCGPHGYDVYVIFGAQRLHVYPADADALGAVEPCEFFVDGHIRRSHNEWRQEIELASRGTRVAG